MGKLGVFISFLISLAIFMLVWNWKWNGILKNTLLLINLILMVVAYYSLMIMI